MLKGYGGSIDLAGGISKWTPLFYAALSGKFECVEFLLAMGANKEISDVRGLECTDLVENEISRLKLKLKTLIAEKPGDALVENLQAIVSNRFVEFSFWFCQKDSLDVFFVRNFNLRQTFTLYLEILKDPTKYALSNLI